jgi:hypothetical protein
MMPKQQMTNFWSKKFLGVKWMAVLELVLECYVTHRNIFSIFFEVFNVVACENTDSTD